MKLYKKLTRKEFVNECLYNEKTWYEELSKNEVLDILLKGNKQCLYVRPSSYDGVKFHQAQDEDIKQFINHQRNKEGLKVKVDVDMTEVKQYCKDNIELLNNDIVIGINKDLELPTVFVDGEKVEDGIVNLSFDWNTRTHKEEGSSHISLNTVTKQGVYRVLEYLNGMKEKWDW